MFGSNNGIKPGFRRGPARFQGAPNIKQQPAASSAPSLPPSLAQILNGTKPPLAQGPGMATLPTSVNPGAPGTPDVMPRAIPLPAPTGPMTGAPPPMIRKGIGMKKGGKVKVSSASKRADGIATKGKTKGRMV